MYTKFITKSRIDGNFISSDNIKFGYHKCFLETYSEYFKNYFQDPKNPVDINIPYTGEYIQITLEQIYSHNIFPIVPNQFVISFYLIKFFFGYKFYPEDELENMLIDNLDQFKYSFSQTEDYYKYFNLILDSLKILKQNNWDYNYGKLKNLMAIYKFMPKKYNYLVSELDLDFIKLLFPDCVDFVLSNISEYVPLELLAKYLENKTPEDFLRGELKYIQKKFETIAQYLPPYSKENREKKLKTNNLTFKIKKILDREKNILLVIPPHYIEIHDPVYIYLKDLTFITKIAQIFDKKTRNPLQFHDKIINKCIIKLDQFSGSGLKNLDQINGAKFTLYFNNI